MYTLLWGKRGDGTTSGDQGNYHPLLFHLMDVAAVTECLWRKVLQRHIRKEIGNWLGLEAEQAGKWLAFWAGLHDLGKASPAFQGKWETGWHSLDLGLCKRLPSARPLPHGILTAAFVPEFLEGFPDFPNGLADKVGLTLGGHHGCFPRVGDLQYIPKDQRGGKLWQEVRRELFRCYAEQFHLEEAGLPQDVPGHAFFMMLAGLVSVADWIGSNEDYFPFTPKGLNPAEYAAMAQERAEEALTALGWLGWRPRTDCAAMEELFPAIEVLRPLQQAAVHLTERLTEPGLVILEAPMGEGKTEAAMYLADRWTVALGQRGCYFALPTMATSNQMFRRVQDFLKDRYPGVPVNFQLLHGHAALSAEFQLLKEKGAHLFIPSNLESEGGRDSLGLPSEVLATEWFTHKKRGLLTPFGVGTVDQALLAVLKTRHYFVRLFGLAGKTVIIDEVHAYDAYMLKLIERLLEWLAALGCSVVVLSATLPGKRREGLLKAFGRGMGVDGTQPPSRGKYPRLTWVSRSSCGVEPFEASAQFSRSLRCEWVNPTIPPEPGQDFALGARLQKALSQGGCTAVICNTVGRAQEMYRALKPYFPDLEVGDGEPELSLFHAHYLYDERERREKQALRRFGKPGGSGVRRPRRAVLVATQVIEQSLDLDFDLMVTDMAPVDLVLQRAGRLHRHVRPRPETLKEPTIWIMAPRLENHVPKFDQGTEAVYERHILLRSWLALKDCQALSIPDDVEDLIEAVYGEGDPPDFSPALARDWEDSLQVLRRDLRQEEDEARFRYILPPDHPDDILVDDNPELDEENPGVHHSLQAVTRLGGPSISAVCLYQVGEQFYLDPNGRALVNLKEKPSKEVALALLRRSVTLTRRDLVKWLMKNEPHVPRPPGWDKHPLLCRCRLIGVDENHAWRGGGYELRLDPEEGVVIAILGKEDT